MIVIYCGTDTAKSRHNFSDYRKKYADDANCQVFSIASAELKGLADSALHEQALFTEQKIYFIENVLSKKVTRDIVVSLEENKFVNLVIWEDKMEARMLKNYFKRVTINSYDLPATIWKLLDGLKPGSKTASIDQLSAVIQVVDEHLVLFMIQRRVKDLLMLYKGLTGKKLADWQIARLKMQLSGWNKDNLSSFYTKLFGIEKNLKRGTLTYSIKQSLEILFCFYL